MSKTVVIFGSSTGTCEGIAEKIGAKLGAEVVNVQDLNDDVLAADNLLLGTSTWGAGELQDDWYDGVDTIKGADLSGKTVAIFGCGDSASYSDTFCGAMKELYDAAKEAGANVIGEVSTDGYTFDDSDAIVDGKFVGLALDDINEDDKTDERIDAWLERLGL
jgi:flavodoxin I